MWSDSSVEEELVRCSIDSERELQITRNNSEHVQTTTNAQPDTVAVCEFEGNSVAGCQNNNTEENEILLTKTGTETSDNANCEDKTEESELFGQTFESLQSEEHVCENEIPPKTVSSEHLPDSVMAENETVQTLKNETLVCEDKQGINETCGQTSECSQTEDIVCENEIAPKRVSSEQSPGSAMEESDKSAQAHEALQEMDNETYVCESSITLKQNSREQSPSSALGGEIGPNQKEIKLPKIDTQSPVKENMASNPVSNGQLSDTRMGESETSTIADETLQKTVDITPASENNTTQDHGSNAQFSGRTTEVKETKCNDLGNKNMDKEETICDDLYTANLSEDKATNSQTNITSVDRKIHLSEDELQETGTVLLEQMVEQVRKEKAEKEKRKRKRVQTRKKLKYIYSSASDDDVPLSLLVRKCAMNVSENDSGDDNTYIPNSKELNSTDTEYYSNLSDNARESHEQAESMKTTWAKTVRKVKLNRKRKSHSTRKMRMKENSQIKQTEKIISPRNIDDIKKISQTEDLLRKTLIKANEGRLDQVLKSNGLKRIVVPPHGNCFFEAAALSDNINETHIDLRQSICRHLEQNMEEYTGFLLSRFNPEDEESFVTEYITEIENLQRDGYWSGIVGDFLPLAVSNYAKCSITIYTSKPDQPVIKVQPTLASVECQQEILLSYISIPNTMEHYDACKQINATTYHSDNDISSTESAKLTATPVENEPILPTISARVPSESHVSRTPRKKAKFTTPVKKRLFRKRKATPENWKKNIRKRLKLSGHRYTSATGKVVEQKSVKPCECSGCRYKCSDKISMEQRRGIFETFWDLQSYERQKDFLCARVQEKQTKTYLDEAGNKNPKRKTVARQYTLEVDGQTFKVCKKFFLKTLDIGETTVYHALQKKECGHFKGSDGRGRHIPHNKTSNDQMDFIRKHIESFPKVSGHYIRKDSSRHYLAADLTLPKLHESYTEKCKENGTDPVELPIYRRVFNEEYNLSFHVPKKDQCNLCNKYITAKADGTLTAEMTDLYQQHQKRKTDAREAKETDKNIAKQNNKVHTCTFDLQSVLYTPCSLVSIMYYMRKLCVYNLSVYSLGDKQAKCYLWSEVSGKRGSNEISTCLHLYLSSLPSSVEHVILYSDSCTGQNRNQFVATCLLYAVSGIPNMKVIEHKFLESGHTHMECDSMHSAIEFAKKKTRIFVPSQWDTVITMARRSKSKKGKFCQKDPYMVIPLKYNDFLDYKGLKSKIPKVLKADSGKRVLWTSIKWMRFLKSDPEGCHFKYEINENDDFDRVKLLPGKRGQCEHPQALYKSKIPISSAKKKDLITLCKTGVIPTEFHEFYKSIPSSQNVPECLPEPDREESESDTEND